MARHRPTRLRTQIIVSSVLGAATPWLVMALLVSGSERYRVKGPRGGSAPEVCVRVAADWNLDDAPFLDHQWIGTRGWDQFSAAPMLAVERADTPKTWAHRMHAGWPVRMATGDVLTDRHFDASVPNQSMTMFTLRQRTPIWPNDRIPYHPIWSGLIANTIFYATLFWLFWFAPRYVRRVMRVRREKCIMCAYPTKRGDTCSECGTIASGIRWRGSHT
ncbi:MAG: hypothetical protein AAF432_16585 [Planctomycetota bacterium]